MSDQISHPYKTIGKIIILYYLIKIIVLYILILKFLDSKPENKRFCTEWQQAFPEFSLLLISSWIEFLYEALGNGNKTTRNIFWEVSWRMIFDDRRAIRRYWSCDWHWYQKRQFQVIWLWLGCFRTYEYNNLLWKFRFGFFAVLVDGFHSSVSAMSFVNCQESVNYENT